VELRKGRSGELLVEPPLMVRGEDGGYSPEKLRIYKGVARGSDSIKSDTI
jgi:tRNA1Val (adenine37-N6)-methyltransferase